MAECPVKFEFIKPANKCRKGKKEKIPAGRSGHCSVSDEANIYVYGGYNPHTGPRVPSIYDTTNLSPFQWFRRQVMAEIWRFNFATKLWTKLTDRDTHTHKTAASACCAILSGQAPSMLVYGGTVVPWGQRVSNKLSLCQLTTGRWKEVPVTSPQPEDLPPAGYGQSMVVHQGYVYVYTGAVAYTSDPISDLHRLELKTGTWQKLNPQGTPPGGRYKQEMVLYKDRYLLIFGGGHEWESASLEQVYAYDLQENQWASWACHEDDLHGFPRSRASFGCIMWEDYVYIFGGRHYTKARGEWALNSCWRLDLKTLNWERLNVILPIDVSFHTANLSTAGYVYLFGGISDINKQKRINHLYRLRVFAPKLSELAWENITNSFTNLSHKHVKKLRSMGVPENFISRIQ